MARRPLRQIAEPLEVPMMPFAVVGTVVWALAGLALLFYHDEFAAQGGSMWLWTCLAGVVSGLAGILTMHVRARRRRRRDPGKP